MISEASVKLREFHPGQYVYKHERQKKGLICRHTETPAQAIRNRCQHRNQQNSSEDTPALKNGDQMPFEPKSPECEHEPHGNNQGFYVGLVKMSPKSNAGNRNKEDECEREINPLRILREDLAWLDLVKGKNQ